MAEKAPDWTPYRYGFNNPIRFIDPDGRTEYESMAAYTKATGNEKLGKGDWLTSDRLNKSDVWKNANSYNLQQENGHLEYKTIAQRTAFYGWFQGETDKKGHETSWAGAAFIIASQMEISEGLLGLLLSDDVNNFAQDGNKAIFDDVFDNLRDLYNGPILTGDAALTWDKATLTHEQRDVVGPIYMRQSSETLNTLSNMAKQTGMFTFSPLVGNPSPLRFSGNVNSWTDRFKHGMNVVVPFYRKYGSLSGFNSRNYAKQL